MPNENVLKLIDILNSDIYQLLSAWFYNYKTYFQVAWIVYLSLDVTSWVSKVTHTLSQSSLVIRCCNADIHLGQGKDWAVLVQIMDQPLLKLKEKATVGGNCHLLPEPGRGEKTSPVIFTDVYWLQRNNEQ